jgi:hypothetical protein
MVYPMGRAKARWNDRVADSKDDELEGDGYAAKASQGDDAEDED